MAAKVHPNAAAASDPVVAAPLPPAGAAGEQPPAPAPATTVLTVWRKSLLFNCDGFTVFDSSGDLAFRVDSYSSASRRRRAAADDVVLMDAAGKPLLTVRRKSRLAGAGARSWLIYDGDAAENDAKSTPPPLLSVRRHAAGGKTVARVTTTAAEASYVVEGSYGQRDCVVRDGGGDGAVVAEVQRKEAIVGDEVFRLVVPSGGGTTGTTARLGAPLAMALVIALDDMFRGGAGGGGGGWAAALRRTWSSA